MDNTKSSQSGYRNFDDLLGPRSNSIHQPSRHSSMPAPNQQLPRVIAFPMQRARARDVHLAEVVVPAASLRCRCSVLPLRRGDAARRAALLVKLRWLHAEIHALYAVGNAEFAKTGGFLTTDRGECSTF
jgi:hypothetical protein